MGKAFGATESSFLSSTCSQLSTGYEVLDPIKFSVEVFFPTSFILTLSKLSEKFKELSGFKTIATSSD